MAKELLLLLLLLLLVVVVVVVVVVCFFGYADQYDFCGYGTYTCPNADLITRG